MRKRSAIIMSVLFAVSLAAIAGRLLLSSAVVGAPAWSSLLPADTTKTKKPDLPEVIIDEEEIPDSLLHPRWKIQRTTPITFDDLQQGTTDLQRPENMQQTVEYNDSIDRYVVGYKIGGTYVGTPIMMTPDEYRVWSERQSWADFYREKNKEILQQQGKEKFDFTNMHFDLGPAEKIFGPGGVRIKTQGTAELKFGATLKNIDNPSLPIRNRKTTTMDFDEKINLNVNGKVGDKVNMNLNYNTDATFDFDSQNLKLKYDGKEDEMVRLVEAGNISFPSNNSLVQGASSLFGIRTDFQFGRLKLQTVFSQKKSSNKSVSSKGGKQLTPFEIDVADYEENRHFFLSNYFLAHYDAGMRTLPNLATGVKINRVISMTFIIGSFLAAVGALLYFAKNTGINHMAGSTPGIKAFIAAVVGGIGSVPGAVVGALLIGVVESLAKAFGLADFSDVISFALLIIILVIKPTGLFGEKTTEKV